MAYYWVNPYEQISTLDSEVEDVDQIQGRVLINAKNHREAVENSFMYCGIDIALIEKVWEDATVEYDMDLKLQEDLHVWRDMTKDEDEE